MKNCEKFKQLTQGNNLPAIDLILEGKVKSKSEQQQKIKTGMSFKEVHLPQLHSIPKLYWGSLERKLEHEVS